MLLLWFTAFICVSSSVVSGQARPPGPPGPPAPPQGSGCSKEGQEFSNYYAWYRCERDPKTDELVPKPMGCVAVGVGQPPGTAASVSSGGGGATKIAAGQKFHLRDMVMQCQRDDSPGETVTQIAIGCLGPTVQGGQSSSSPGSFKDQQQAEHKVGETWEEGEGVSGDRRIKYKYRCDQDGQYHVTRKAVQCLYTPANGGGGSLDGGCMKMFGDTLVQCIKRDNRGTQLRAQVIISPNENVQMDAAALGLKMC